MNLQNENDLMEAIVNSEELSIFKTVALMSMADFKWTAYAFNSHKIGCFVHFIYIISLILYINHTFLESEAKPDAGGSRVYPDCSVTYMYILFVCLMYPVAYDGTQMFKQRGAYFTDPWNYIDMLHISMGYANIMCQVMVGTWDIKSKVVLIVVVILCLIKTFFFMRIVQKFSYIVTMITMVISDLQVFMLFFIILIVMFSMIFDVIAPNKSDEYRHIGKYMGNFFTTLRLSLGDFDFSVLQEDDENNGGLNQEQHILFWITWVIMVIFSALIFLNFIIAEVSNSYQQVKDEIDALIYKEKSVLIQEAEDIMSEKVKETDKLKFPKYIVIREMEKWIMSSS